jgi:hypothetical protein
MVLIGRQTCISEVSCCILNGKKEAVLIYINELETLFEKSLGLIWKMVPNSVLGALIRLVDVNTLSWAIHISISSVASVYS